MFVPIFTKIRHLGKYSVVSEQFPNNPRIPVIPRFFSEYLQDKFWNHFFLQYKPLLYLSVLIFGINKEIPVCCSLNEISVNGSSDINYFQKSEKL